MNAVYSGNDREDNGNDARATAKKKKEREREKHIQAILIVIGRNGEEKQTNKQRNNRGSKTAIEGSASRRSTQKKKIIRMHNSFTQALKRKTQRQAALSTSSVWSRLTLGRRET